MTLPTELFDSQKLTTDPVELIAYEVDAGFDRGKPDGAFFPENNHDVSRLVRWAREQNVPLIARAQARAWPAAPLPSRAGSSLFSLV